MDIVAKVVATAKSHPLLSLLSPHLSAHALVPLLLSWTETVLLIVSLSFLWETYLKFRQHLRLKLTALPSALGGIVTQDEFGKARVYGVDKSAFGMVSDAWQQVQTVAFVYGGLRWLWGLSGDVAMAVRANGLSVFLDGEVFSSDLGFWKLIKVDLFNEGIYILTQRFIYIDN